MFPTEANAVKVKQLLIPGAKTTAADSSGSYVDVSDAVGSILVIQDVGSVSGSIQGALWTGNTSSGGDATTVLFNDGDTFDVADLTGQNAISKYVLDANNHLGWLKYAGTPSGASPSVGLAVSIVYRPKWTS